MEFMMCTSCSGLVSVNSTGICLGCQRGFKNTPQEDSWRKSEERAMLSLTEEKKNYSNLLNMRRKSPVSKKEEAKKKKLGVTSPCYATPKEEIEKRMINLFLFYFPDLKKEDTNEKTSLPH